MSRLTAVEFGVLGVSGHISPCVSGLIVCVQ